MSEFNPTQYLTRWPVREKRPDGSWVSKPGPDYLPVAARIAWFRTEHPDGSIDAQIAQIDAQHCVATCEVRDGAGRLLARDFGLCTAEQWKRYAEKAGTTAIGRALAAAGYGTLQAGEEFDDSDHPADNSLAQQEPAPPKPAGDPMQRKFWATALDLGYVNAEGKISKRLVHEVLGLAADDGALSAYMERTGETWEGMVRVLTGLGRYTPPNPTQGQLVTAPAQRQRPEAANGQH